MDVRIQPRKVRSFAVFGVVRAYDVACQGQDERIKAYQDDLDKLHEGL